MKVAFVCVQNAGRSQMATAFAKYENKQRGTDVEVITGGTDPADHVHPEVIEVMKEKDMDLSDREPRSVTPDELKDCEIVITMGCGAEEVCPATWSGESRDWDLTDPDGGALDQVRRIRDDIQSRVSALFDELQEEANDRP